MAKSKKAAAKKPSAPARNKKTTSTKKTTSNKKKQPRRASAPQFLTCPETNAKIWITTATLADIKAATKRKRQPFCRSRQYLVTVPSATTRLQVYEKHATAMRELEERLLPEYGGRPWTVVVKITDNTNNKSPYFCFQKKGQVELAAWPHLMERIPDPPRFPGYSQGGARGAAAIASSKAKAAATKSKREPKCSPEGEEYEEVEVVVEGDAAEEIQDGEENHVGEETEEEEEGSESEAEEEEEPLTDEQIAIHELQDREESSLSRLAYKERWRVPLPNITIKWISPLHQVYHTRKSAWEAAVQLCRNEVLLDKMLRGYGSSGLPIKINWPSKRAALKAGKIRFERDGLWVVGQEEAWQLERLRAVEQAEEEEAAATEMAEQKMALRRLSPLAYYLHCNRQQHRDERLREMKNSNKTILVDDVEVGMNRKIGEPTCADDEKKEETPKEKMEEKKDNADAIVKQGVDDTSKGKDDNDGDNNQQSLVRFTLRDAERELRSKWKALSEAERSGWTAKCHSYNQSQDKNKIVSEMETGAPAAAASATAVPNEHAPLSTSSTTTTTTTGIVTPPSEMEQATPANKQEACSPDNVIGLDALTSSIDSKATTTSKISSCIVAPSPTPSGKPAAQQKLEFESPKSSLSKSNPKKKGLHQESTHWRLNEDQIKLCYDAGMEHFDHVMRTVKARDLSRELQDGFNLFRERGSGRYDMELPVFEEKEFRFLNDMKKAPWLAIVQEILGKDAVLIHKGMFLSMPGSSLQPYHQDGVHLTTQYQKPCHAVNVFVPLIDLTLEHGPTEFCLGSHILGQEDFEREYLVTPTVSAGTPIIFDYRLGHRGLANTSSSCRPIVYCSYARASDGKEFRDSVNFSKKRYHQLGDLVDAAPTREERARKRERMNDEYWPDEVAAVVDKESSSSSSSSSLPGETKKPRREEAQA